MCVSELEKTSVVIPALCGDLGTHKRPDLQPKIPAQGGDDNGWL